MPPDKAAQLSRGVTRAVESTSTEADLAHVTKTTYRPRVVDATIPVTDADRAGHRRMLRRLQALRDRESKANDYYGSDRVEIARQKLSDAVSLGDQLQMWLRLTFVELELGNESAALNTLAEVERFFERTRNHFLPKDVAEVRFRFGMVHLRHGETQNCCMLRNKDSCLLPIRDGGIHTREGGSRAAVNEFKKVVNLVPRNSKRYLETAWLWNLASMTLGEHPQGVPEQYRMDPERFLSQEEFPRLRNIATKLGLDTNSLCGSVVADDFNNDGYLDLMVGSWDLREPLRLYVNDGAGKFDDRTADAGLEGMPGGLNMVQGDYNNDGRIDVYVLRGAWLHKAGRHPDSLLRNNGDDTFTDVTYSAGLADVDHPSQTAAWADFDLDGQLDLYVGREDSTSAPAPCQLFRNNGDGTFTDVAVSGGVTNNRFAKGVIWGDYNDDRYPDIYVSNLESENRLFRNNGDGTFTDVAREAGVADVLVSFPTWFWDFDNDGVLDLFVASFDCEMEHVARYYLGQPVTLGLPRLFRGTPSGQFVDVTGEVGLDEPTLPMGSNFGDLDNDGFLDMYLGTGSPDFKMIMPNKLYRNHGGREFSDVSEAAGLSHLQKGHGVAIADFDADGDQDVFIQMGGAYTVDKYVDALYENPGFGNNYVSIELVGVESNRFGVGSRIGLEIEEDGHEQTIYRWVNSGGSFGCNPLRQQIGVGKAVRVKRLEVYWPTSDQTQSFDDVPVNCIVRITEGADEYVETILRPTAFARPAD
jgi:hypothetical protein